MILYQSVIFETFCYMCFDLLIYLRLLQLTFIQTSFFSKLSLYDALHKLRKNTFMEPTMEKSDIHTS